MKLKEKTKEDIINEVSNKLAMNQSVTKNETKEALHAINQLIEVSKGRNKIKLKYERDYIEFKSSSSFNNYLAAGVV